MCRSQKETAGKSRSLVLQNEKAGKPARVPTREPRRMRTHASPITETFTPPRQIETLWWPLDVDARRHDMCGRDRPEAWRDDLREVGLRAGDTIWFLSEDVISRFDLRIYQNGEASYPVTRVPNGASVTTDEGHCALSIPDV